MWDFYLYTSLSHFTVIVLSQYYVDTWSSSQNAIDTKCKWSGMTKKIQTSNDMEQLRKKDFGEIRVEEKFLDLTLMLKDIL